MHKKYKFEVMWCTKKISWKLCDALKISVESYVMHENISWKLCDALKNKFKVMWCTKK